MKYLINFILIFSMPVFAEVHISVQNKLTYAGDFGIEYQKKVREWKRLQPNEIYSAPVPDNVEAIAVMKSPSGDIFTCITPTKASTKTGDQLYFVNQGPNARKELGCILLHKSEGE